MTVAADGGRGRSRGFGRDRARWPWLVAAVTIVLTVFAMEVATPDAVVVTVAVVGVAIPPLKATLLICRYQKFRYRN